MLDSSQFVVSPLHHPVHSHCTGMLKNRVVNDANSMEANIKLALRKCMIKETDTRVQSMRAAHFFYSFMLKKKVLRWYMRANRHKSPNCDEYTDHASTMFSFHAHDKTNPDKDFQSFMISCQTKGYENPDTVTMNAMKNIAKDGIEKAHHTSVDPTNIHIEAHGVMLGTQSTDLAAEELQRRRMASNCAPHFDLNKITSYNQFQCNYLGTGVTESGRKVRNPFQTWKGTLPSCESTFELSEQTEEDIRKLVYLNAGGKEAQLNLDDFVCRITSIPML